MKKSRKICAMALAVVLLMAASVLMFSCGATEDVKINKIHFPDAQFREYVSQNFDRNGDEKLNSEERSAVTQIIVSTYPADIITIHSLRGIEYFPNLQKLVCDVEMSWRNFI